LIDSAPVSRIDCKTKNMILSLLATTLHLIAINNAQGIRLLLLVTIVRIKVLNIS